jgi:hypothetical protein
MYEFVQRCNAVEGSSLTVEQVKDVISGGINNVTDNNKEELEAAGLYDALLYVKRLSPKRSMFRYSVKIRKEKKMKLIDGKIISASVKERVKEEVEALKKEGITTGLAVIIVGEDPASKVYVANKKKACEMLGIISEEYALPENTTQEELLALIDELNNKTTINGILCQLPLPKHLDEQAVINAILPQKDVDAFHPQNVGKIHGGCGEIVHHGKQASGQQPNGQQHPADHSAEQTV